jgi:chromosome segregation ATPase
LEGLSNYDDTSIQNAVNSLTTQIDTLVSGDASVAIESFNEIIAFLNGVEDSENLDSIIAAIEQQIAAKQDKLVSGTNIKTINGQSIVGSGNVVISVDTSNLVTKEEFEDLTNDILDNEEVVASAINDLNIRINELSENVSGEAATKVELAESVATINETIAANDKRYDDEFSALDNRIDELAANVSGETVTKVEFEETITNITNVILDNEEVVASAFNDVNVRINELAENVSGEAATKVELNDAVDTINQTIQTNDSRYAQEFSSLDTQIKQLAANVQGEAVTKTEFQETLSELNNEILDNEEVVASAINDLNARIAALEDIITTLQNS